MKLFTKTLLFFAGAIAFQSILGIIAISRVTERTNLADAHAELESEAAILYDSFHAWKRQTWVALNTMARRRIDRGDAARTLREAVLAARVDAAALAAPRGATPEIIAGSQGQHVDGKEATAKVMPAAAEMSRLLVPRRDHPYLDLVLVDGVLCLVGVASVPLDGGQLGDILLVKRLDSEFCSQLVLNRRSHVGLFLGERYLAGSFPNPPAAGIFDPREAASSILERLDVRVGRERFNACWQRIGGLNGSGELFFATFLSRAPYQARVDLLDRTVLIVSAASGLLTIGASLFLSRNITHPIADLHAGMARLQAGGLDVRVAVRGGQEIARLSAGFNDMVQELQRGRTALDESLRESVLLKEYNEKIVNSIRAGIAIVDADLVVESANSAFVSSLGLEGAVGRPLASLDVDVLDASLAAAIHSVLDGSTTSWSGLKRSSSGRVFEVKLYPFAAAAARPGPASRCVIVCEDVTSRAELEQKIMGAEKLSSISVMSAGMAHEINNPLGSILSNAQNLIAEERDPERRVALGWIEHETLRIARVVAELLHFASAGGDEAAGADVNAVVEDVIRLLRHSAAHQERVCITARLAADLPLAALSADELAQVTLNLVRNSLQAIDGSGRILVCTRRNASDGMIALSVADTGSGIAPEVLPRIFDPFFTTKPTGEGTGLGLSVVYGIVNRVNGTIGVRSRVGAGTRIRVGLPCLARELRITTSAAPRLGGGAA